MKTAWLFSVKMFLKIGLWFYFRRIRVVNKQHLKITQPALIVCNHQNALLDPLLIATSINNYGYFLTRAGVFKKPFVAKLLASLNMLPVYRIRDGWNNLTNNNDIFEKAVDVLQQEKKVTIFPEGSHNLARRVRPLSKGFTRIVLSTLEKDPSLPLKLIPVGVNYQEALKFGDSASMYVGEPIDASSLVSENKAASLAADKYRQESVIALKQTVFNTLTELTTHIPEEGYEETLEKLNQLNVNYLKPSEVNSCIQSNFSNCKKQSSKNFLITVRKLLKFTYCISIFPVYLFWKWYVQPKIKELEFTSTFRFAVSAVLIPILIICVALALHSLFGSTIPTIYVLAMLFFTLIVSKV